MENRGKDELEKILDVEKGLLTAFEEAMEAKAQLEENFVKIKLNLKEIHQKCCLLETRAEEAHSKPDELEEEDIEKLDLIQHGRVACMSQRFKAEYERLVAEREGVKAELERLTEERGRLDERLSRGKSQLMELKLELERAVGKAEQEQAEIEVEELEVKR